MPKTIDNDIVGTTNCFGFDTAVDFATGAIDRLHTTAEAHRRILVVEVMGRYAGWIALYAGVAGGADAILIPEIPFEIALVAEGLKARDKWGARFSIVVVAEGAFPKGGSLSLVETAHGGYSERLGGSVRGSARRFTMRPARKRVPSSLDTFSAEAPRPASIECWPHVSAAKPSSSIKQGEFGTMVASDPPDIIARRLEMWSGEPGRCPWITICCGPPRRLA